MTKRSLLLLATLLFTPLASNRDAQAASLGVDVHGFFSLGYATSDSSAQFLGSISNQGDFASLSDAGIQIGAALTDRISTKLQIVAEGRNNRVLTPAIDLAEVHWLAAPGLDVILGQVRLPLYMTSDYRMVGSLYPWVIPPAEVYQLLPNQAVGSNETFDGVNVAVQLASFSDWVLQTEVFGGGSQARLTPPGLQIDAMSKRVVGADLSLSNAQFTARAAYLNTLNQSTTIVPGSQPVDSSLGTIQFLTAGLKWEPEHFLLQAEFAHTFGENPRFEQLYSGYATLGLYLLSRSILLQGTYASIFNFSQSTDSVAQQSLSGGINYSFADGIVLKTQVQSTMLPGGPPQGQQGHAGGGAGGNGATGQQGLFAGSPGNNVTLYLITMNAAF